MMTHVPELPGAEMEIVADAHPDDVLTPAEPTVTVCEAEIALAA